MQEDSLDIYNQRIEYMLVGEQLAKKARQIKGPATRFKVNDANNWEAVEHPGYTVITPPFEEETSNVKTYARLANIQQVLQKQITLGKVAPAPVTAFHLTVADLIAGTTCKTLHGTREQELLNAMSLIFNRLPPLGCIQMELGGVSLFTSGFIIAVAIATKGYERLVSCRDAIYCDEPLKKLGVERKFRFTGHVTLAYIESILSEQAQDELAKTLTTINHCFFAKPLPLGITRAEVRKFDNMLGFYRQGGWPVFEFV